MIKIHFEGHKENHTGEVQWDNGQSLGFFSVLIMGKEKARARVVSQICVFHQLSLYLALSFNYS